MCCGFVPKNIAADTEKYVRVIQTWGQARNMRFPSDKVPAVLTDDHAVLALWLCQFSRKHASSVVSHIHPRLCSTI